MNQAGGGAGATGTVNLAGGAGGNGQSFTIPPGVQQMHVTIAGGGGAGSNGQAAQQSREPDRFRAYLFCIRLFSRVEHGLTGFKQRLLRWLIGRDLYEELERIINDEDTNL